MELAFNKEGENLCSSHRKLFLLDNITYMSVDTKVEKTEVINKVAQLIDGIQTVLPSNTELYKKVMLIWHDWKEDFYKSNF